MRYALSLRVPDGAALPSRQALGDYVASRPYDERADDLVIHRNPDTEVNFYVALDKVLDAKLVQQVLAAPPIF